MKTILKLLFTLFFLQGVLVNSYAKKIHLIGDSTMADYDENTTDKRGWGMMFQQFFTSDLIINNRAKSGASSKSFYEESAYWQTVKTQIESGDYVFIQFAHNDEKNGGLDGDTVRLYTDSNADYRGTTAQGTYKKYLRKYITESRELGATPVLVTPICRKYFSGNTITRKGQHDLGADFGVPETDNTYDYVSAMKEVASELSVEVIDLTTLTVDLYLSYGDEACTELLFCNDDSTHPNAMGGTLIARLCAQAMSQQGILAEYVNASSDLQVNPSECDFGNAYVGQAVTKELTITGFDLSPESGSFTLNVSEGFSISAEKTGTYSSSIAMDYANGNLDFTRFYIMAKGSASGISEGILTITNGEISKTVPLSADFIELTGGTEVAVNWDLSANSDYVLSGPAIPVEQTWSNMYLQKFSKPNANTLKENEDLDWDVEKNMQRNLIDGDVWPANEIDEVSTRYMQFGIIASDGTELNIDSIGMYIAGAGGNGMRCRISYSVNDFTDYVVVREFASMVANTVYAATAIPVVKLKAGESLLLRVYPWYGSEATGKTICIADVTIHGMATTTTTTNVNAMKMDEIKCIVQNDNVRFTNTATVDYIEIVSINGQLVYNATNVLSNEILVDGLKPGMYIMKARSGSIAQGLKFVITN